MSENTTPGASTPTDDDVLGHDAAKTAKAFTDDSSDDVEGHARAAKAAKAGATAPKK